jgi:hypothetical protein
MSGLKLLAEDEEDLKVISAHLQDAVIRVGDLAYLPKHHRFAAMLNRFCWEEDCGSDGKTGVRVLCGLHFDGVLKVQSHHVRQGDSNAVIELLAINFRPGQDGAGTIDLMLAGGGCIRLSVECIAAALRDITEPRPAVSRPAHNLEHS